jgi:hypothetical protein
MTPINTSIDKRIEGNIIGAISQKKRPEDQTIDEWLDDLG